MRRAKPLMDVTASWSDQHGERLDRGVARVRILADALGTIFLVTNPQAARPMGLTLIVVAIAWGYSLWVFFTNPYERYGRERMRLLTVLADAGLIFLWVYVTGGIASSFVPLLFVGLQTLGVRLEPRTSVIVGALYPLSYLLLALLTGGVQTEPVRVIVTSSLLAAGSVLGVVIAHEVKGQVEAQLDRERALAKAEATTRLGALLESSDDAVITTDDKGLVTSWNAAAERMLGTSISQAIGRSAYTWVPPPLHNEYRRLLEQVKAGRRIQHLETERLSSNGSLRSILLSSWPLYDRTGRWEGELQILRDISERKAKEDELKKSQAQLAHAQRVSHLGSLEWEVNSGVARWSDELFRVFGFEPGGFTPTPRAVMALIHPADRARVQSAISDALATRSSFDLEHRILRTDGAVRTVQYRGIVSIDAAGLPERVIGTLQDITERKLAEQTQLNLVREKAARAAAEQSIQVRDEFLALASHELRTPLTTLKLQIQNLKRLEEAGRVQPAAFASKLESIDRQVGRLASLVTSLLDVTRITSGRLELEIERLDLIELVRASVDRGQELLAHPLMRIQLSSPPSLWGFWDRLRVGQVIDNLLSNAVKYGQGSPIEVRAWQQDDRAFISVRDHGPGISAQEQARLFQRFEKTAASRNLGGLGLGLWIVRQFVEAMGGSVKLQSAPGEGSTFTVKLPLDCRPFAAPKREPPPTPAPVH